MLFYPAIFHEDKDGVWAEFPDLEGCQTYSDTLDECILEASNALGLYAESVLERGLNLPQPSKAGDIPLSDKNSFVMVVYCNLDKYMNDSKSVKKTLTIPQWLNERAIKYNVNFSETLKNALIEKVCR